jgi:hypothetical protein
VVQGGQCLPSNLDFLHRLASVGTSNKVNREEDVGGFRRGTERSPWISHSSMKKIIMTVLFSWLNVDTSIQKGVRVVVY